MRIIEATDSGWSRAGSVGDSTGRFRVVGVTRPPESRFDAVPRYAEPLANLPK